MRLRGYGADPAQAVGSSPFGDTVMQVGGDVALVSPSIISTQTLTSGVTGITELDTTTPFIGEVTFMGYCDARALPTESKWFIKVIYTDAAGITHTKFANSGDPTCIFTNRLTLTYTY